MVLDSAWDEVGRWVGWMISSWMHWWYRSHLLHTRLQSCRVKPATFQSQAHISVHHCERPLFRTDLLWLFWEAFSPGTIISSQELCKIKTPNGLGASDGPLRRGWVTGLREDVPRQRMWKGRKEPKPDCIRVDYRAIFQSSQALGFSLPDWSDQSFYVFATRGKKKKKKGKKAAALSRCFSTTTMECCHRRAVKLRPWPPCSSSLSLARHLFSPQTLHLSLPPSLSPQNHPHPAVKPVQQTATHVSLADSLYHWENKCHLRMVERVQLVCQSERRLQGSGPLQSNMPPFPSSSVMMLCRANSSSPPCLVLCAAEKLFVWPPGRDPHSEKLLIDSHSDLSQSVSQSHLNCVWCGCAW